MLLKQNKQDKQKLLNQNKQQLQLRVQQYELSYSNSLIGPQDRTRTYTLRGAQEPESSATTNFATRGYLYNIG